MAQNVENLRNFFDAFFALNDDMWGGFLAGWPGLPGNTFHETWSARLVFAFSMFLKMTNKLRLDMILYSIKYTLEYGPNVLLSSLTPDFLINGGPPDSPWKPPLAVGNIGDEEAKREARLMIKQFIPSAGVHEKGIKDKEKELLKETLVQSGSNSTDGFSDYSGGSVSLADRVTSNVEIKEIVIPAPFN